MKKMLIILSLYASLAAIFIKMTPPSAALLYDAESYVQAARIEGLYTAQNLFIDKGYPLFLKLIGLFFGSSNIFVFQVANYILWASAAYLIYKSLFKLKQPFAEHAAVLMLFSPLFLSFSAKIYSEALASFGVALAIYALTSLFRANNVRSNVQLYVALVIVFLTKSIFVLFLLPLIIMLIIKKRAKSLITIGIVMLTIVPGIVSSMGGGRSLYNLAIQSSKIEHSYTEIISCFPYYISYPLGRVISPSTENICRHNDPALNLAGYNRNPYVLASKVREAGFDYIQWLQSILINPIKYAFIILVSMGNIVLVEGIYPSILIQLPFYIQVLLFVYKIALSLGLWYLALRKRSLWLYMPLAYFTIVVGNFPIESRYFYPLIPILYFVALMKTDKRDIRVAHLTTWSEGGAAVAANRLSEALSQKGIKNQVVTANSLGTLGYLWVRLVSYFEAAIAKAEHTSNPIFRSFNIFPNWTALYTKYIDPQVIHIHWIGAGFMSLGGLRSLNKPIVWTLHDLWPVLGAEHLPGTDKRMIEGYVTSNRATGDQGLDLTRWIWLRKKNILSELNVTFVAPSKYIEQQFKLSAIGKDHKVVYIPNGIELESYEKKKIISHKTKTIFYGALNAEVDKNKGLDLFKKSLEILGKQALPIHVRVAGVSRSSSPWNVGENVRCEFLGNLSDQEMKKEYANADITVVSSYMETLSFVTLESMAVGTPVVAFRVGGIPDLIDHKVNGYLAKPYDTSDLARGIQFILNVQSRLGKMSREARRKALKFGIEKTSQKYLTLYNQISAISDL